ncbi:MAG TPA: glutathione transferase GstA [Telluria sp.]|nr:glutathione transferase GstA [Telluria sp.]
MKLYYSPGACSLAPHILLRETGLAFALERVDTSTHRTEGGADFFALNPKGQVPLIEDADRQRLSEGPVIAQYIAERAGRADLLPDAGTMARYRVMEWQNYITSELHKTFTPLFNPAIGADAKAEFRAALAKKFAWVSSQLQGRAYLTGKDFTVADAYLFTVARWSQFVALDLTDLEPLQAYLARIAERPAVREAMRSEGLLGK